LIRKNKIVQFAFVFLFLGSEIGAEVSEQSLPGYRIANRKQISHLLIESTAGRQALVLIATHPLPWAFKAESHALKYYCGNADECVSMMLEIDRMLRTGYNLGLRLDGSRILEIKFFPP